MSLPLHPIYEHISKTIKSLSSPHRIKLLELLAQGEKTVELLSEQSGLSFATTSHHLQTLKHIKIVDARKKGLHVYYSINDDDILEVIHAIRKIVEKRLTLLHDVLQTYHDDKKHLDAVGQKELLKRMKNRSVIVLDVRPREEYLSGHIKGAVSIPLSELEKRIDELKKNKDIIAYCRGPYCILAPKAVEILQKYHRNARRLDSGFPEWKISGLPVSNNKGEKHEKVSHHT